MVGFLCPFPFFVVWQLVLPPRGSSEFPPIKPKRPHFPWSRWIYRVCVRLQAGTMLIACSEKCHATTLNSADRVLAWQLAPIFHFIVNTLIIGAASFWRAAHQTGSPRVWERVRQMISIHGRQLTAACLAVLPITCRLNGFPLRIFGINGSMHRFLLRKDKKKTAHFCAATVW
jgi:hypothetical protein